MRWSVAACVALAVLLWVGPYLLRPDLFYDDVAHHVFWLYRYADPSLFVNDITVAYFQTSAPWGYRALYAAAAPFVDVLFASKVVSAALLAVSCLLAWQLGRAACSRVHGEAEVCGLLAVVALVVLLPLSQQRDLLPPIGFQRTFALPLLLVTLWALVSRRYAWVGVSWLAAALFYPVVLPVQGLTAAIVFLRDLAETRRMPSAWQFNLIAGIAAVGMAALSIPVPVEIGPAYSYHEAIGMPEFGPGGRLQLYADRFLGLWLTGHRTGFGWSPSALLIVGAALTLATALGRARQVPFSAWTMALIGAGLWAAMRVMPDILMFGLYLPNRHSRWAIGVFSMLVLTVAAAAMLERDSWRAARAEKGVSARSRGISALMPVLAPVLVAGALLPGAIATFTQPVNVDLERTYDFIRSLPESTLVAAHPDLANFVPVRTRRSVLTSTEVSMAWMKGYYAVMKPRVEASLSAAYATSVAEMDAVLEPYGVDVMLTGPSVWEKRSYYRPFDGLVRGLVANGERDGFVLQHPPADRILFRSGDYYVVRVGHAGK